MDWITDDIAIGNHLDARDNDLIRRGGFRSLLSLDGSAVGIDRESTSFDDISAFKLIDGAGNDPTLFERILLTLRQLVVDVAPVLVQCHAGRSRSVVAVAAHLMRTRGLTAEEALELVGSRREIALTPGIEELLDLV